MRFISQDIAAERDLLLMKYVDATVELAKKTERIRTLEAGENSLVNSIQRIASELDQVLKEFGTQLQQVIDENNLLRENCNELYDDKTAKEGKMKEIENKVEELSYALKNATPIGKKYFEAAELKKKTSRFKALQRLLKR